MSMESKSISGNILFKIFWWVILRLNPQWANRLMYFGLRDGAFGRIHVNDPALSVKIWGHSFKSPVGIGGGVDKRGNVVDRLMQIGYSFGTFGPYTLEKEMPIKQTKYLKKDRAILVQCLGFRNPGLLKMLPLFVKRRYLPHFIGVDLAIPAESEDQNIKQGRHFTYQEEFVLMAQKVAPYCDFITLDLSHPDSELSMLVVDASTIVPIIKAVKEIVQIAAPIQTPPILVKIPLDLNDKEIDLVAQGLMRGNVDGVVVAGPLSMSKNLLLKLSDSDEENMGQLIGAPLQEHLLNLIGQLYEKLEGRVPIIACGGVFNAADAWKQIKAGATMIQVDNATLTYAGPTCVTEIHEGLLNFIKQENFQNVMEAIGFDTQKNMAKKAKVETGQTVLNPPSNSAFSRPVVTEQPLSPPNTSVTEGTIPSAFPEQKQGE